MLNNDEDDDENNDSDFEIDENEQSDYIAAQQLLKNRPKPTPNRNTNGNSQLKKIFNQQTEQQQQQQCNDQYFDEINNEQSNEYTTNNNNNNVIDYAANSFGNGDYKYFQTPTNNSSNAPYASRHLNNPIPYDILNLDEAIAVNYHTLDTQEIAVKLKEILTNYEISREVFGEAILNASRKVTNYILTAPKTFQQQSKLYQERYLKVKMWLDDSLRIDKIKQWKSENNCM